MECKNGAHIMGLHFQCFPFSTKNFRKLFLFTLSFVILFVFAFSSINVEARPVIALVLGGGAARGFCHVGLIQAFEEAGIPIDIIVGSSMGSVIGGLYAFGYSTSNMIQIIKSLDPAQLFTLEYTAPGGIVSSEKFELFIDELLDNQEFDNLKTPFYPVITELRTGEEVALNEGKVSKGIQASSAIPGLFPPVLIGDTYFVDGGMKNAVPVNVARDLGADIVIAVDVKKDLKEVNYKSILQNLQLALWFMIDGYVEQHIDDADVVIVPDVKYDSYVEFSRSDHFIEEGYKAGMANIEKIKATILALDPGFVPEPYISEGYSEDVVAERIGRARKLVLARSAGIRPFISGALGSGMFPDIGLTYSTVEGHKISVYLNDYVPVSNTSFGIRAESLAVLGRSFWADYKTGSAGAGLQLGIKDLSLFEGKSWQIGAAASIEKTVSSTMLKLSSELQYFIKESPMPVYEVLESNPYIIAGVLVNKDMVDTSLSFEYVIGMGSQMRLFGLYPMDVRVVMMYDRNQRTVWRFGLQSGLDAFH